VTGASTVDVYSNPFGPFRTLSDPFGPFRTLSDHAPLACYLLRSITPRSIVSRTWMSDARVPTS
jgi:hypothetical protein